MKKTLTKVFTVFLSAGLVFSIAQHTLSTVAQEQSESTEVVAESTEDSEETPAAPASNVVSVEISADEEKAFESEPAFKDGLRIAYNGGICTAAPGIALALGYYEEEGLKADIVNVQSEYEAIGTGQADIANGHIATELVPIANGVNATTVTGAHTGCKSIFVFKDSGIKSMKDLEGKTVALPAGVGSADQNITFRFLKRDGVDPNKVKFKQVETGACLQAVENAEVDAAILTDSFVWEADKDGKFEMIRSLSFDDDFNVEACCATFMNNDFIKANPVATKKATRAVQRARQFIQENPEKAVDIMFEKGWATGDRDNAIKFVKSLNFAVDDATTADTIKKTIADYKEFGFIRGDLSDEDVMKMAWTPQHP